MCLYNFYEMKYESYVNSTGSQVQSNNLQGYEITFSILFMMGIVLSVVTMTMRVF